MRTPSRGRKLLSAGAAAIAIAGLALAGCTTADDEAPDDETTATAEDPADPDDGDAPSAEELVLELLEEQSDDAAAFAADHLPMDETDRVDPESIRSLGSNDLGSYWVGIAPADEGDDDGQEICLFAQLDNDVIGSSCVEPSVLDEQALSIHASGDGEAVHAYLFPADVFLPADIRSPEDDTVVSGEGAEAEEPGDEYPSPHLLALSPADAQSLEPMELPREDGEMFAFTP